MNSIESAPPDTNSVTMQLTYPNKFGMFTRITETIGKHGGDLGGVDLLGTSGDLLTRGVSGRARDQHQVEEIVAAVRDLEKVKVIEVSDPVFRLHQGGKIAMRCKTP